MLQDKYGSLKESFDWCEKARTRNLLTEKQYTSIFNALNEIPKLLYQLINFTDQKLKI
ncbi:MAG: four helix bundle protein [Bacteroidales bacterium]|nr:four helix bundle protein [Bacteroidales bacterium]MCF8345290.1 four helix bundle protein [Bacteroidales bacterium]MCF8352325.1 four helix bundle protein [Bacteroidales bacterium]MCF8377395.1 four helix bundle protein [Bacteroidales bacterium]MCF8401326.1 four helix bundle protein [Bacteroidales bacterium]